MKKNTIPIRVLPEDRDILRNLCAARWMNKNITLEKKFPTPAKIIKLALRQPEIRLKLASLPAREDL